jgi:hypothetical protein
MPDEFENGDHLLVAVPILSGIRKPSCVKAKTYQSDNWRYEIEVVTICCDEHFFRIETNDGETWGWEFDDIDWLIKL